MKSLDLVMDMQTKAQAQVDALQALGEAIKGDIKEAQGPDVEAQIASAVQSAVAPLNEKIATLEAAASAPAPVDTTPFAQADIDAAVAKVTDADAAAMKDLKEKLALDDQKLADVKASFKKQIQAVIDSLSSDQSQDQKPAQEPAAQDQAAPAPKQDDSSVLAPEPTKTDAQ